MFSQLAKKYNNGTIQTNVFNEPSSKWIIHTECIPLVGLFSAGVHATAFIMFKIV